MSVFGDVEGMDVARQTLGEELVAHLLDALRQLVVHPIGQVGGLLLRSVLG